METDLLKLMEILKVMEETMVPSSLNWILDLIHLVIKKW
jgi:hypothetical protein